MRRNIIFKLVYIIQLLSLIHFAYSLEYLDTEYNQFNEFYNKIDDVINFKEIHGPFTKEEYKEMKVETENVVNILKQSMMKSDEPIIEVKNVINQQHSYEIYKNHTDSRICKSCLWSFSKYHNLLEKKYGLTLFNDFLALFCAIGLDFKICKLAIELYSPTIVDSLIEHYLDAEYICTKSKLCWYSHYNELNPDDYARELLKDKPAKKNDTVDETAPIWKVLHVTDIHTDLLYEEVK
jgi:hypothetical protein